MASVAETVLIFRSASESGGGSDNGGGSDSDDGDILAIRTMP